MGFLIFAPPVYFFPFKIQNKRPIRRGRSLCARLARFTFRKTSKNNKNKTKRQCHHEIITSVYINMVIFLHLVLSYVKNLSLLLFIHPHSYLFLSFIHSYIVYIGSFHFIGKQKFKFTVHSIFKYFCHTSGMS